MTIEMHKHHIIPRHMGGSNEPDNLTLLTIPEHADAHRILYETHGKIQDKIAWLMLSGKTDEGEILRKELARQKHKEYFDNPENYAKSVEHGKKIKKKQMENGGDTIETRKKRSENTKRLIKEGKIKTWGENISPERNRELYESKREKLVEGRLKSDLWYEKAHGIECKKKRGESIKKAIERGDFFTEEHKEKIRKANSKPKDLRLIVVNDKLYIFKKDACSELQITGNALMYRVKSDRYPNYRYATEDETPKDLNISKILFSRKRKI